MRKSRPNKHRKWTAYVKDAAKEYKAGGKPKRKRKVSAVSKVGKVGKVRRRRRVSAARPSSGHTSNNPTRTATYAATSTASIARRRAKPRRKSVARVGRRRVGSTGSTMKSLLPVLLIGGGLAVAYMLMKKSSTAPPVNGYPPLINTANPQRNQTSQNILNYAMAAGLTTDAILKLISALNRRSDADVKKVAETVDSGGGIPDWVLNY